MPEFFGVETPVEFKHGDIVAVYTEGGKTAIVIKNTDGVLWAVFKPGEGEPVPLQQWRDRAAFPLKLVMPAPAMPRLHHNDGKPAPAMPRLHHNDGKPMAMGRRQFKKERALAKAVSKKLRRQR